MRYSATITTAPLRLRESRKVADLLIRNLAKDAFDREIVDDNIFQLKSPRAAIRISRLLRARLLTMDQELWLMVRDGSSEVARQAALAAAVKHSRLLGDFMDIVLREKRLLFAERLGPEAWPEFLAGCRGRDPEMPEWSDSTIRKLRNTVYQMLVEAGYLANPKSAKLLNVFVDRQLASYLAGRGEHFVLRCLEVAE
ncbi:MAG: DUF1819 family protein [bacterium]|nr:DUF1819 family protein [bacterium]